MSKTFYLTRPLILRVRDLNVGMKEWIANVIERQFKHFVPWSADSWVMVPTIEFHTSESVEDNMKRILKNFSRLNEMVDTEASVLSCIIGHRVEVLFFPHIPYLLTGKPKGAEELRLMLAMSIGRLELFPQNPGNTLAALKLLRAEPMRARFLSGVLSSERPGQQVSAVVRLFEAAFGVKHSKLEKPLHRFLSTGHLDIQRATSDIWIANRHKGAHAKYPNQNGDSYFDMHLRKDIEMQLLAAYDVALNKKRWGFNCIERTREEGMSAIVGKNQYFSVLSDHHVRPEIRMKDPFFAFPPLYAPFSQDEVVPKAVLRKLYCTLSFPSPQDWETVDGHKLLPLTEFRELLKTPPN